MANTIRPHQYSAVKNNRRMWNISFYWQQFLIKRKDKWRIVMLILPMWRNRHNWSGQICLKRWDTTLKGEPLLGRLALGWIVKFESLLKFRAFDLGRHQHKISATMSIKYHLQRQMLTEQQILQNESNEIGNIYYTHFCHTLIIRVIPGIVHANIPNARSANVTATAVEPNTSSGDKIV